MELRLSLLSICACTHISIHPRSQIHLDLFRFMYISISTGSTNYQWHV